MISELRRALVVEDFPDAASWLKIALSTAFDGIELSVAPTLAAARTAMRTFRPDLALVDLGLPDGDGIELIAELRARKPAVPSIVTTIYDDDEHVFPALRAGACGYVLKEESQETLVRQLHALVRGELPLSPTVARSVMQYFSTTSPTVERVEALTNKEREILVALASGDTLAEVAERLQISRNTVATHVKRVYDKLNVSTRAEAMLIAVRLGMVRV